MSKQVHYHQHGREPIVLHVVKEHKDGTFDLARTADGEPIITGIAIGTEVGDGKATPVDLAPARRKGKGKKADEEAQDSDHKESDETEKSPADNGGDSTNPPPPDE